MKEEEPPTKAFHITGNVFVYGCLAMVLVAVTCGVICVAFATNALHNERDLALRVAELEQRLGACTLAGAKMEGRVMSFERALISPKRTAIEASLQEFNAVHEGGIGGEGDPNEPTVADFEKWLKVNH